MAKDGTSRGGAREGAGRKKRPLCERILEGKAEKPVFTDATFGGAAELSGADMPPPQEYLSAKQQNGKDLIAADVYKVTISEVKGYLGLDGGGEQDRLLAVFLASAEHTVEKVLRNPITDKTPDIAKTAVLYAVWQLYFHRDDSEFKANELENTVAVMLSDLRRNKF